MYQNKRENQRIIRRTVNGVSPDLFKSRRAAWYKSIPGIFFVAGGLFATAAVVLLAQLLIQGNLSGRRAQSLLEQAQNSTPAPTQAAATMDTAPEQATESGRSRVLDTAGGYSIMAKLTIPKFALDLPVIGEYSEEALKVSICHFMGPLQPGDEGNLVITGHNFRNGSHFGRIHELCHGDQIILMDAWGNEFSYEVYDIQLVLPDDAASLDVFEGRSALTLVTCENKANRRLLVRCRLVAGL